MALNRTGFRIIPFAKDLRDPKKFTNNAKKYLTDFVGEAQREFSADYGRVPESPTYRRTGELARGWRSPASLRLGGDYSATLINFSAHGFVQGPKDGRKGVRQPRVMGRKGWRTSTEVLKLVEKKQNRKFFKTMFGSK